MDMHEIAELVAGRVATVRLRQGEVTAVASDGTIGVKIGGSSTEVAGVKAFTSACPVVGAGVWLATDGVDLIAIGTIGAPAMPTGAEMMWPVATPPAGWLIEDGSSQLVASYPALSALIRGTYGGADASHFYLPDMSGMVPVGNGGGVTLNQTGGETSHTLTAAESGVPAHSHPPQTAGGAFQTDDNNTKNVSSGTGGSRLQPAGATGSNTVANASSAHNNLQPFRVRNFVIKT